MKESTTSTNKLLIDINLLKENPNNPREISEKDFKSLKEKIKRWQLWKPILVWESKMIPIGGNMRLRACKELGYKEIWVEYREPKDEAEALEMGIADNESSGEWVKSLLIEQIQLHQEEINLEDYKINIKDTTLKDLMPIDAEEDEPPNEEDINTVSVLGDLYELNNHRVLAGDSTMIDQVEKLMNGKKADISFTSPPYNVGHNIGYNTKSKYIGSTDDLDNYKQLIADTTNISINIAKDVFVNLQILANNKRDILKWLSDMSEYFKDIFFWKKLQVAPAMAKNVANSQVELIMLFGKDNNSRSWGNKSFRGDFSNYIETKSASGENTNSTIHSATYPLLLPISFLKHGYTENSIVLDLFAGTGTNLIACEKLNMISYNMDLEPRYVDVIVARYIKFMTDENKPFTIKRNGEEIDPAIFLKEKDSDKTSDVNNKE